jgi:cell division septation protein DedD
MAVSSAQDIQEQIRQQQLIGMAPSAQQQPFHPMTGGTNYGPYVPQLPYPVTNVQNVERNKGTAVNMGKLSLLSISFSLMLLGAFTFLGGFLLGLWVAAPRVYVSPPQQNSYYPTGPAYPQEMVIQQRPLEQNVGRHMGSAAESAIKDSQISGVPTALSPFVRVAQSEIGKQVGAQTEDFLKQQLGTGPSYSQQPLYPQQQYSPPPTPSVAPYSPGRTQLPVVTSQSGVSAHSAGVPLVSSSQENGEGYTIQLGVYSLLENANALMNHLQSINYPSHVVKGKTPDGIEEYYVRSGFYKDYTTALNAASQFSLQNIPGAIIVKTSPQHANAS